MSTPTQAEDPFADLADSLPPPSVASQSNDDGQGYIWKAGNQREDDPLTLMTADQHNVAPAPPPTKIKILKRRNTTDRKAEGGTTTATPTTEDLESRAKEKELEYQRARERILGNDADALLTTSVAIPTPPQRSTTNSPSGVTSGGMATPSNTTNGYQASSVAGSAPTDGSESFTSGTSAADSPAGGSSSINSTRGKQRSPGNNPTSDVDQEDMSEYRRMPVAYVPTSNPNAPGYAAVPYTPAGYQPYLPNAYPVAQAPIGYVHLPGIPAYPIPPPPTVDQLRSMNLAKPRNPPPFPIYPPTSNNSPPFVLFPIAGTSPPASVNGSRTGSPASAVANGAGTKTSPARSGSAASNPGCHAFVASDATAGTAAGLLERQMAGMHLGAQQLPLQMYPGSPMLLHQGVYVPPPARGGHGFGTGMGRGAPSIGGPQLHQQQQQAVSGADVRRSRSGASNRGRGRLWKPSS